MNNRLQRVFLVATLLVPCVAHADDDHERAREALARGDIMPLSELLPEIEERYQARMIDVELERHGRRFLYEIELITEAGQIIEARIDATSGRILEQSSESEDDD